MSARYKYEKSQELFVIRATYLEESPARKKKGGGGGMTGGRQKTTPRVVENSTQAFGKSHLGVWNSARTQLGFSHRNL